MLSDCLFGLVVLTVVFNIGVVSIYESKTKNTLIGTILLRHKVKAMDEMVYESFSIIDGESNNGISIPVKDCHLVFHPNGTAAKSGTCQGDSIRFTLRPGESGIGYPW